MPKCIIKRYCDGQTKVIQMLLPVRVTVTGNEDHFARAVEDAWMILAGMTRLDEINSRSGENAPRYWLHNVELD